MPHRLYRLEPIQIGYSTALARQRVRPDTGRRSIRLTQQLDFVFFFYGLGFILLAASCFILNRSKKQSLPWVWLGLFGFLHGLNEWLDMFALSLGDSVAFKALRVCLMAASFMCLVEFGRRGTRSVTGEGAGRWIAPALLVAGCAAWAYGWTGLNVSFRYSLGFVGCIWAAFAFVSASRSAETRGGRRLLLALAALFATYAVVSGLVTPKAPFLLAALLNSDWFLHAFGFPVQLLRGALAVGAALCLWHFLNAQREHTNLINASALAILLLAMMAGGWVYVEQTGAREQREFKANLLSACAISAASVNPDLLNGIDPNDGVVNPRYSLLKERLMDMQQASPEYRWLHLTVVKGGKILILVDSEPTTSPEYSPPGGEYSDAPEALRAVCRGERQSAVVEYRDKWGSWISAFAPVRDPATGKTLAVFGLDCPQEDMRSEIGRHRLPPIIVTLLAVVLLVAFFVTYDEQKQATERIKASEKSLRESEEQHQTIIRTAMDGFWLVDTQGRLLEVNEAYCRMSGYSAQELLAMRIPDLEAAEMGDDTAARIEKIIEQGEARFESRHHRKDGSLFDVEVSVQYRPGEGGRMVAFLRDITERKRVEEAFAFERVLLKTIIDNVPVAVYAKDVDCRKVLANSVDLTHLGKTEAEVLGRTDLEILPRDIAEACMADDWSVLTDGISIINREELITSESGESRWLLTSKVPWLNHAGETIGLVGVGNDITERKRSEAQVRLHSAAINAAVDLVAILNNDGEIVFANDAFHLQTGYSPAEIMGRTLLDLWPQTGNDRSGQEAEAALGSGVAWIGEILCGTKDGLGFAADITVTPLPDEDSHSDHMVVVARNITERKAYEGLLDHQAHHDALTGLPNRLLFSKQLALAVMDHGRTHKQCAALCIDLDKFKVVNDTLGHQAGDALLIEVAARLSLCLREGDMLARMGGDEFTVLLENLRSPHDVETITERMLEQVSRPFEIAGSKLVIAASIGVATFPKDATQGVDLLKSADAAMYRAKELGRNNCQFFSEALSRANQARVELEQELRAAFDHGDLKVYYQPIVDVETMRIAGAEALLRWNHPEKGMISPGLFIPVAEETGLIVELGSMVLETACRQCRVWNDMGFTDFKISVNISPVQLRNERLPSIVGGILSKTGLSPSYLNLEITETVLAKNEWGEIDALGKLRAQGIICSLDDFGIGYSSLSRLKDFPVTQLKVDGAFIRDIEHSPHDRAMTESIITLAHNLGITVTAEWIENDEQLATIKSLRCDYAQGYLFSPAVPAETLGKLLRDWQMARTAVGSA